MGEYSIHATEDEDGTPLFFVTDERGDYVDDPHPTIEAAREEAALLNDERRG